MSSDEPRFVKEQVPTILQNENIEIRRYDEVLIASVKVQAESWRDASSLAFRPLANYIFGANGSQEQIGMTTPVTTHQVATDKGPMWEVRFFMPDRYDMANLPDPQSPYITLDKQKAKRFAVIRFSGAVRQKQGVANFATHESQLRKALEQADLPANGIAHYAVYDGPWTPSFMRRNEVLITLD